MGLQDLQIDWLQCFVAVVDAGSLSHAAPMLHRSQSAVSMQLKKLERALDCTLLIRQQRGVQLTADGQQLLGYARRLLDLHAQTLQQFQLEPLQGKIRLGVPDDYAARYLTPVLKQFAPHHRAVEIEVYCEQSTALIPRIERGDLDLALVSREHAHQGSLLFYEPLVWVGKADLPVWQQDPLPIAVYEEISLAKRSAIESLALQGRPYRVVYHCSSLAGQIAAVESGLAVAVLTQCSVPAHLSILTAQQGLGPLQPMQVALYRSQASHASKAVDALAHTLMQTLRQASC